MLRLSITFFDFVRDLPVLLVGAGDSACPAENADFTEICGKFATFQGRTGTSAPTGDTPFPYFFDTKTLPCRLAREG